MRARRPWIPFTTCLVAGVMVAACSQEPQPQPPPRSEPPAPTTPASTTPAPPPPAATATARATPPAEKGYTGPLPALPTPPFALPRPQPVVQAVYEFAARHPEVLRYVPCFCGCERQGHGDNADCFVASREADGRPRWELHGMG